MKENYDYLHCEAFKWANNANKKRQQKERQDKAFKKWLCQGLMLVLFMFLLCMFLLCIGESVITWIFDTLVPNLF